MAIKANISKDQKKELQTALNKLKVPKEISEEMLSSQNASNTYKAFRQGKKVETKKGDWVIHFGSKWARPKDSKAHTPRTAANRGGDVPPEPQIDDLPSIDEESLPDSPPIEVEMPSLTGDTSQSKATGMVMISFQIERELLMDMQKLAQKQGLTVNQLSRLAIKRFLDK
ncbi:hypothetical protein GP5015_1544 [gamma proteobacterium HTCC5015]|nr:hypothetical protein GP5015_1544 [gamma proteobacterium HTCC5015]